MSINPYLIKFNFNPWKANVGDCAIRAIVAATGLDYRAVCKQLGVSYKKGRGLIRDTGIDLQEIEIVFSDYFDIIEDFYDNNEFVPDEMRGSKEDLELAKFDLLNDIDAVSRTTLNEFIEMYRGNGTFLVSLDRNPEAKNVSARREGGHIVCVKCNPRLKKQGFIDTWDSGEMLVDAYMRVAKTEPKDSPLHWKYDREKHQFIV